MSIYFDKKRQIFKLDTQNTSYVFCVSNGGFLEHLYYGKKIADVDLRYISHRADYSFAFFDGDGKDKFSPSTVLGEYPSCNAGDFRSGAVLVENADGTQGNRLHYQSHTVFKGRASIPALPHSRENAECETLSVLLKDEEKGVEIELFYTVYGAENVIARYQKITNVATAAAYIERAASLCVDFNHYDFDLIELCGTYAFERGTVQRTPLKKGKQGTESQLGTSSHITNPFFALANKTADEHQGEAYGFNLVYSGSFSTEIEVDRLGNTRALSGINPTQLRWRLGAGESFYTPEGLMTYSSEGIGGMSRNFHNHIRKNIIEERFVYAGRPIVINTWEGAHFDITEESVLALADEAKKVGADTVVLDDGWFRNAPIGGLGDWNTVKEKFPSLPRLADKVHEKGLKFGIWVEPEMAATGSNFVENYPDKILKNRENTYTGRNQYVIDLTDDKTVEYIFKRITDELDGVVFDYMKWDANRYLTEVASKTCSAGEAYHRQILGVYKLFEKFKAKYPDVLFENCSGGGGRFDLGMLYYAPQIWTSDHTEPYARAHIQYGTSIAYPTSAISCHYTKGRGYSGFKSKPEFRYIVASFGPYGYELDLTKLSEQEKARLKRYTNKYKKIERYALDCDLYRLESPANGCYCAHVQVSKDKTKALFTFLQLQATAYTQSVVIKLKGLEENKTYKNLKTGEKLTGGALMHIGLRLNDLWAKSGMGLQIEFHAE